MSIPLIDVASLFGPECDARRAADQAIAQAAGATGFMTISGLPGTMPLGRSARAALLQIFALPEASKRKLWRRSFDPARPNLYRGYFPLQGGGATYKEGIDMGPDIAHLAALTNPADPLTEATPLPPESELPGWRNNACAYYLGMERLGQAIMRSLARSLDLAGTTFDAAFNGGISTLRLIRYPMREDSALTQAEAAKAFIEHNGIRRQSIGGAHIDSGFVTLLAQDGVEGLQARARDGRWIDVPPAEGTLAVNFGGLLARWTGGRIKATEHRVLSPGRERFSIPFFYEPRVDAVIRPLPGGPQFESFTYGDHLWSAMTKFIEFRDLKDIRKLHGVPAPS